MNTTITKNLREFIAYLKDGRELNITREQKEQIEVWKREKKSNEFVQILDIDTRNILYQGEIGAIKEF